jgi:hypothetical protein
MLVEINALEPTPTVGLPEWRSLSKSQFAANVRRLVAQGLVRRYSDPHHSRQKWLTINREHQHYDAIREVLCSIGAANGIAAPPADGTLDVSHLKPYHEWVTYELGATSRTLRSDSRKLFGHRGKPIFTLFGWPNRTRSILLLGAVGTLDGTSIADAMEIDSTHEMLALLRPIEDDDIFECEVTGNFNMYRLKPEPWTPTLHRLIGNIVDSEKGLRSQATAVLAVANSGTKRSRPRKPGIVRRDRSVAAT